MSLPPLPKPYRASEFMSDALVHSADQMHAHAAAARLAALEEAATALDRTGNDHCAAAIRLLAIHVGGTCTENREK